MEGHSSGSDGMDKNDPGEAMEAFFSSFGNLDGHARIVIEEFLEALIAETKK